LLDDIVVGDHAVIINSIVGWGSSIGSWTRIEGILKTGEKKNKTLQEEEYEGYYHNTKNESQQEVQRLIKNGVTVIGAGTVISSEIHIRNCVVLPNKKI
jgi:mannose-1-phosphate guanylyltransferase